MKALKVTLFHWWEVAAVSKLLRSDFYRMYHNKRIWLCVVSMIAVAAFFIIMQYTAMDYTVDFSRVIFLPMAFYGIVMAALVSLFVGDDFSDGFIRNKIVVGRSRSSIYMSNLICVWSACLVIYVITVVVTVMIGINYFENDVTLIDFFRFLLLGAFTCLCFGSIFCMLAMLIGNRSTSLMICMGLTFVMLFVSLRINQIIVQPQYKDGILNPHFVGGIKRVIFEIMHDINPFGQIAQLTSMTCLNVTRWICLDILWIIVTTGFGNILFLKKDIK